METTGHSPCNTCGACCRSYIVPLNGRDVWELCVHQRFDPSDFVTAFPLPKPSPEGFRLNKDGFTFGLALDKQGEFEFNRPCTFLMSLGGGHSCCGVYAHRPTVCRSYPVIRVREHFVQRKDSLCPPNAWSAGQLGHPSWRQNAQRVQMQFDLYYEVIARWNARVVSKPEGTTYVIGAYYDYLLNVYERLAGLDDALGEDTVERVVANWSSVPASGDFADESIDRDQFPWLSYLSAAREVIDAFYPEVPSQPSIVLHLVGRGARSNPPRKMIPDELLEPEPAAMPAGSNG